MPLLNSFLQPHSWNELSDTRMELIRLRPEVKGSGTGQAPSPTVITDLFGEHVQGYAYGG